MIKRASGIALLLVVALPPLLGGAGDWVGIGEGVALAQQQPADAVTEVARQRFEEGVKAFDAGRFEDARGAFLQAYALKRHPAVLLNLGLSELRSNHVDDAGNHLQQYLREHTAATPEQRSSAEKGIADAKKRGAYLVIGVDAQGADVSIDGTLVGKAPIVDPVFVKPGKHTLIGTYEGKSATGTVDAKIGIATSATLTLGTAGAAAAPPPPVTGAPPPAAAPPSAPPGPGAPPPPPPSASMQGGLSMGAGTSGPAPDQGTSGREPFFHWYTHHPLNWVLAGVTVVGLGVGIGFSVAAARANDAADRDTQIIREHAIANGDTPTPCGSKTEAGMDAPGYASACDALRQDISDYNTDVTVSVVGWVAAGVGVAGTVTYALVGWLPSKEHATTGFARPPLQITPVITPTHRGLGIAGRF